MTDGSLGGIHSKRSIHSPNLHKPDIYVLTPSRNRRAESAANKKVPTVSGTAAAGLGLGAPSRGAAGPNGPEAREPQS